MASTRDIRRRIKSVRNTAQITKAMQLVASSKMRRAQEAAVQGRPYAMLMAQMLRAVTAQELEVPHPFLEQRRVNKRGILVVSTDKGLCGALNANLFREIGHIREDAAYVAIGRKATQFLARTHRETLASFSVSDRARFAEVRPAVELMIEAFGDGTIDTIEVLYPAFKNTLSQVPRLVQLVPITDLDTVLETLTELKTEVKAPPQGEDTRELHFEPSPGRILSDLLSLYVKREAHQAVLEAKASEQSARMVAMKTATDNANKLVEDLNIQYNKARQAAITQEIQEISASILFNE